MGVVAENGMTMTVATAAPLPPGIRARSVYSKVCAGVTAEAIEWHCEGPTQFDLTCDRCRVGVVLEQIGGKCETRTNPRFSHRYPSRGMPFANLSTPAMPVWACSDGIRYTRSLSLAFDRTELSHRLGEGIKGQPDLTPRLNFAPGHLRVLAEMLAGECRVAGPFGDSYAEALIVAMLVEIARLDRQVTSGKRAAKLAPRHLRLAMEHMEQSLGSRILLADLAGMTGLSQWHFSRAFKASTGMAPYQWHLRARIRRAQQLLLDDEFSVAEVAAAAGFADQAHFTRLFRRSIGVTPAIWRKARLP